LGEYELKRMTVLMLLGTGIAITLVRIVLGLYWADHGLEMYLHQGTNPKQLDLSMTRLKPSNSLGSAMVAGIRKHYSFFSKAIPLTMLISGLFLLAGVLTIFAALATVVFSIIIVVMEPKGPGSARNLLLLIALGLVIAATAGFAFFLPLD
jgi:uncharacterized membrane protein YphA (DoxX/SURF4 family)